MNAYPPELFVRKGPYRLFRHPIYWGFGIFLIGFFIRTGSASGLWLVTPIAILGMIALVSGYEAIDLRKRFPGQSIKTWLDLPAKDTALLKFQDRLVALLWVVTPWLSGNFIVEYLTGNTPPLWEMKTTTVQPTILLEQAWLFYLSVLLVLATPFLLKSVTGLREWALSCVSALALSLFLALLVPAVGAQYLLMKGLPLFTVPVFLILLSMRSLAGQSKHSGVILVLGITGLVIIQLAVSRSPVLHLFTAIPIFLVAAYRLQIWIFLRRTSERIANSWREWVFGKVRVINHGFYVGFGTFFGILLAGILAGKSYAWGILIFTLIGMIISALWAQLIEGSEKLKRPFGYYGSLVGGIFSAVVVWAMGYNGWVIAGVIAVLMPWVQANGRLRCLINGCCHGGPVDNPLIGIRYFHQRSRVCGLSGLKGELLHPTPLYAIIWLFFVGFVLLSLWINHFSGSFILGLYLILAGLGRFVEEAYRGEVQTPFVKGLRLYQWTAILSVIVGIGFTFVNQTMPTLDPGFSWETVAAAMIGGLFTTFAMGVDFPYSNARFSRLV